MTLTLPRLAWMADTLHSLLANGKLQEIRQPEPETLILSIRVPGATYGLLINATPGCSRCHLTEAKWPNAPTPPAFLQRCRKELRGVRLLSVIPTDGSVELLFEGPGDDGPRRTSLLLDVHPLRPNGILLDSKRNVLSRIGPSPCPPHAKPGTAYRHHSTGKSLPKSDTFSKGDAFEVSREMECHYEEFLMERRRMAQLTQYRRSLKQALKRETRKTEKVQRDLDRAEGAEALQRVGELLKGHQHNLKRGMTEISVPDYFTEGTPTVVLPLDPRLDGPGNVRRLFHQARRLKDAYSMISKRVAKVRERVSILAELEERLSLVSDDTSLMEWIQELHRHGINPVKQRGKKERHAAQDPYRTYLAEDDTEILVGRNAIHNDTLSFKVARGDDLWLHARGRRGAHVILRVAKGKEPNPNAIEDAAQLAAYHSEGGKTDTSVEVWVVPRKHVRKVRNGPPGAVTVSKGKTRLIRPSERRLARLLGRD